MDIEKIFHSKKDIKYIYNERLHSKYLVVIFSGYSTNPNIKAMYNYARSLNDIDCNKLFILDDYGYDERGCWYLGENLDFKVEYSVNKLIKLIQDECGVKNENIILSGSSKGGFASVYYGIKYKYGHIIAGAPQIILYNYLVKFPNILKYMSNESTMETKRTLEDIVINLNIDKISKFYLYCGINDSHLENHIIPLIERIDKFGNSVYIEISKGDHSTLGIEFGPWINNIIKIIIDDKVVKVSGNKVYYLKDRIEEIPEFKIKDDFNIDINNEILEIGYDVLSIKFMYAIIYIKNGKIIESHTYQTNSIFKIKDTVYENYEIIYIIRDIIGNKKIIYHKNNEINIKNILKGNEDYYYELDIKENRLNLTIKGNEQDYDEYAYYIFKNGVILKKIWYTFSNNLEYIFPSKGSYKVKYFIKRNKNEIFTQETHYINI